MKRGSRASSPKRRRSSEMQRVNTSSPTEGVGPDGPHEPFLGHDLTGVRSKAHEHLHDLGFQASGAGGARDGVEQRLDMMELADAEAVLQHSAPCGKAHEDSTSPGFARLLRDRFIGSSRARLSRSRTARAGSRGPAHQAHRRCPAGTPATLDRSPTLTVCPTMCDSEADLTQLKPPQPRRAGRILHGLVASPRRISESGGHPRLEQHEIAAAGVDQQSNLLSCDGHPHRQETAIPAPAVRLNPLDRWEQISARGSDS